LNTSWFIAKRISSGEKQSFSRFIIGIAVTANTLSMAVMVIAICMVSGFTKEIKERVFGFWGHIQVRHFQNNESVEEKPIIQDANLLKSLQQVDGLSNIAPYITKAGIIRTKEALEGIVIKGVDETYDWDFISGYLSRGELPSINAQGTSREILVSAVTARRLQVDTGSALIVYFLPKDGSRPLGRRFEISGIYHTGLEEYDQRFALADIRVIQELNGWDGHTIGGYELKVNDLSRLDEIAKEVYLSIDVNLNAMTIREAQPNIFDWLDLQVMTEVFALVLMLIVALMNMITSLLILILDRTRMIGILKAIGANNMEVQKIFLFNAMIILLAGLLLGNGLGLGLCWLQQQTGFIQLDESSYYFTQAPIHFDWWPILAVNIATILITILVLLLPSMIITRISPVKAIRWD
jgi:lipoprotein-releasing system permease protein